MIIAYRDPPVKLTENYFRDMLKLRRNQGREGDQMHCEIVDATAETRSEIEQRMEAARVLKSATDRAKRYGIGLREVSNRMGISYSSMWKLVNGLSTLTAYPEGLAGRIEELTDNHIRQALADLGRPGELESRDV